MKELAVQLKKTAKTRNFAPFNKKDLYSFNIFPNFCPLHYRSSVTGITYMKNLFTFQLRASTLAAGLLVAYVCCFSQFGVAAQSPPPTGKMLLQKARTHADWFNWVDAAGEFQQAEKVFESEHDRRNSIYARIGFLGATMEDDSLGKVRDELQQISKTPEVQSDPKLLLFASIAKADVNGELNAQDARNDWQQIEILAKAQNDKLWAIRAPGERSFSEFLLGNISKGRILVATALAATQKTQDIAGQIRYLTAIGAALHISDQGDQAFEYLTKAADLVRAHPAPHFKRELLSPLC